MKAISSIVAATALLIGIFSVKIVDALVDGVNLDEVAAIEPAVSNYEVSSAQADLIPTIDFEVRGIRLGSTQQQVLKTFGKPLKIEPWSAKRRDLVVYHYDGLEIRVDRSDGQQIVDSIEILSTKYEINGVRIGSEINEVISKFGVSSIEASSIEYQSLYPDAFVNILHDGSKVIGISSGLDGC